MESKECIKYLNSKKIVLNEKKSTFSLMNPNEGYVKETKVDGCLINEGRKFDYMLSDSCESEFQYFIELKGKNIKDAVVQLTEAIPKVKSSHKVKDRQAFIVCSKVPHSSNHQKLQKQFFRKFKFTLTIKNFSLEKEVFLDKEKTRKCYKTKI